METITLEIEDLQLLEEATEHLMANTERPNESEERLDRLHLMLMIRLRNGLRNGD